jgi:hypothetical protein
MELTCNHCKTKFMADGPKMSIANAPLVSTVSVVNVRVSCPNPLCRHVFVSAIGGVNLGLVWPDAPPERENKIVLPGREALVRMG